MYFPDSRETRTVDIARQGQSTTALASRALAFPRGMTAESAAFLGESDEEGQKQQAEHGCLHRHGGLLLMIVAPLCAVVGIAIAVLVVKYSGDSDGEPTSRPARLLGLAHGPAA